MKQEQFGKCIFNIVIEAILLPFCTLQIVLKVNRRNLCYCFCPTIEDLSEYNVYQ